MSVGDSPIRHDAAAKTDGSAVYAADAVPAGALHAKAVFSGKAHARMVSMSTEAAEAVRGVVAVLVAYLIGAALATQHVLGSLTTMGMNIDFGVWAHATLHDLIGMAGLYAPLLAVAFLLAMPVILLVCRGRPG